MEKLNREIRYLERRIERLQADTDTDALDIITSIDYLHEKSELNAVKWHLFQVSLPKIKKLEKDMDLLRILNKQLETLQIIQEELTT